MQDRTLAAYLAECRALTIEEIRRMIPRAHRHGRILYELMLDYPLRDAKGLRPALCIATCRALGGQLQAALRTAAVIELYHNAFLIHDDVEDGSELRRSKETLHRLHGVPVAINVGDAMLALALEPLLENTRDLGLSRALRVLQLIARMARETAEGQALELDWIARRRWDLTTSDYVRMVHKKTGWYTFIAPVLAGAIIARASEEQSRRLGAWAMQLGIAFQIHDDFLNLVGEVDRTGKERAGDLWEGKRTLILSLALRAASLEEREQLKQILSKSRPGASAPATPCIPDTPDAVYARLGTELESIMDGLQTSGHMTSHARDQIRATMARAGRLEGAKTRSDIEAALTIVQRSGAPEAAAREALRRADRAQRSLCATKLPESVHRRFLETLTDYVVRRDH